MRFISCTSGVIWEAVTTVCWSDMSGRQTCILGVIWEAVRPVCGGDMRGRQTCMLGWYERRPSISETYFFFQSLLNGLLLFLYSTPCNNAMAPRSLASPGTAPRGTPVYDPTRVYRYSTIKIFVKNHTGLCDVTITCLMGMMRPLPTWPLFCVLLLSSSPFFCNSNQSEPCQSQHHIVTHSSNTASQAVIFCSMLTVTR